MKQNRNSLRKLIHLGINFSSNTQWYDIFINVVTTHHQLKFKSLVRGEKFSENNRIIV